MKDKLYSCGMCGVLVHADGTIVQIPENYNPNDYDHTWCDECGNQENIRQQVVTKEMAIDAGMPEIEGWEI